MKHILIGVSWPYTNGPMHIGHLAGQNIVCDVFARFHRIVGNKVAMVSGSDMHGTPITTKAEEKGVPVEEFVEQGHQSFLKIFEQLSIKFDLFTKTRAPNHIRVAQNFITVLSEQGFLSRKKTMQYFDTEKNRFLADRYIEGTCPHCGYTPARGDQCDTCGHILSPQDLINPISKLSKSTPILKETEELYFEMGKLQKQLEQYIETKKDWRKNTLEFTKAWLKEGLHEKPISRDIGWGIPIPIKDFEQKVIYVWFEAVIGYLSATIELAELRGNPPEWEEFWKDNNAEHYYFIAKDNIPFHTLFWPAQLLAYNTKYEGSVLKNPLPGETLKKSLNLPTNVVANMYLNIKGEKMSKSKGTQVLAQDLLDKFSPELVRYFFIRYAPENHDLDFNFDDIKTLNNNELVATLGNYIYRVLSYVKTRQAGKLYKSELLPEVENAITKAFLTTKQMLEKAVFASSLMEVMTLAQFGNQYFNNAAPWKSTDEKEIQKVLFNATSIVKALQLLLRPYIPSFSEKIAAMLNIDPHLEAADTWKYSPIFDQKIHEIGEPTVPIKKLE
ncbi:methionine--tRNA ligase [bacterium]|nr:methionine--tRNA ligase [bacterium]